MQTPPPPQKKTKYFFESIEIRLEKFFVCNEIKVNSFRNIPNIQIDFKHIIKNTYWTTIHNFNTNILHAYISKSVLIVVGYWLFSQLLVCRAKDKYNFRTSIQLYFEPFTRRSKTEMNNKSTLNVLDRRCAYSYYTVVSTNDLNKKKNVYFMNLWTKNCKQRVCSIPHRGVWENNFFELYDKKINVEILYNNKKNCKSHII